MKPWHPLPAAVYSFVEKTPETVLLQNSRSGDSSITAIPELAIPSWQLHKVASQVDANARECQGAGIQQPRNCYSRLFTAPVRAIAAREFADLPALFEAIEDAINRDLFVAGFFAYECGQYFEPTAALRPRREDDLLAWFGIYDRCCCFDHSSGLFLDDVPPGVAESVPAPSNQRSEIRFGLAEEQFSHRIEQIHNWIRAGDVYQLNFTFPLRTNIVDRPAALYARLSSAQPADYAAFLHCQRGRHILSLSPELFFRIDQHGNARHITTQPMKGTAHRGRTPAEDREIAEWLRNDPKNRAENVMIVDLIRNDLGRICSYGSVRVEELFSVDRYPTIWQMTSTITGDLRPGIGYEQIFRALFPCGSITGAPKVRAMQLLAQIEGEPRGVYTGAIGYFSREQTVFNVAIRTLLLEGGVATMGVGSGIVIDSDAQGEYRECALKAEFLTRPTEDFSLIETMLWNGSFPLLELHLDRLADSAGYFDFLCDRTAIKEAVLAESGGFMGGQPRKVRLLLGSDGLVHIVSTIVSDVGSNPKPLRVCFAAKRTDPADRFLFHKTTRRALYIAAFAAATASGFADAIFLNTRGEVTEAATNSLFIEKSGRWYTPPLDCGALPGVYRRYLLETRPGIEEKALTMDDLKAADSVYISNAVSGLRRVVIDFDSIV